MLKNILKYILLAIFLNPVGFAWSTSTDTEELRSQQQKLKELLDRIGEAQDQRKEQRTMLRKLEKQMSCNWELIQDYDVCEKNHKDHLEEHINCKREAKKKAVDCISTSAE